MTDDARREDGGAAPEQCFTAVFKGDIRKFQGNPFKLFEKTEFGELVALSVGDALAELDELRARSAR